MRTHELLANLLIVLLGAMGLMRGAELIIRSENSLQRSARLYTELSQYVNLQSIGWFLVTASIVLITSVFVKGRTAYILMLIGGICAGSVHIFYGLVATEGAKVVATYYTTLTIGIYQYIIATVGVMGIWKNSKNKE